MIEKIKSRKFVVTVASGCVLVFAEQLGIAEQVEPLVALVAAYLLGQSFVDRAAVAAA